MVALCTSNLVKCTLGSPGFLLSFVFHPMEEKESPESMGLNVCLQMTDLAKHFHLLVLYAGLLQGISLG